MFSCQGFKNQCQLWTKSVPATEDVLRSCGWSNPHCEVQEHATDCSEKQFKCKSWFRTTCNRCYVSELTAPSHLDFYFRHNQEFQNKNKKGLIALNCLTRVIKSSSLWHLIACGKFYILFVNITAR